MQDEPWTGRRRVHVLVGAAVGLVSGLTVFGSGFLWADADYWRYLWGDAGSGLSAFRYFVAEPWGFPLLEARGLNRPDGINIAFTDSLPAMALVAKALSPLGIPAEAWWGWWFLGLHVGQGAAAAWAARAWGNRSPVVAASVAVIAVSAPIFLLRTWHPGLAAQCLLLAAWAWVGEARSERAASSGRFFFGGAAALAVVALLTHVYLLLGVLVVLTGGMADLVVSGRRRGVDALGWLVAVGGSVLGVGAVMGYFSAGAAEAQGYEYFGMHLFGPVVAQRSTLWPGNEWTIQAFGSFEAFNWVGFGWIAFVVLAVGAAARSMVAASRAGGPRRGDPIGERFARHQMLMAALVLLTVYSVTYVIRLWDDDPHDLRTPLAWVVDDRSLHPTIYGVGALVVVGLGILARRFAPARWWPSLLLLGLALAAWGGSMLTSMAVFDAVTGQFRIAGRLFWTVSYGFLAVGAGALGRTLRPDLRPRPTALVVAGVSLAVAATALIQVVDVSAWREQAATTLDPTPERIVDLDAIAALIDGAAALEIEPAFNCADVYAGTEGVWAFQDVGIVAAWERTPTDRVYAARRADEPCDAPIEADLGEGEALVVVAPAEVTDELLVVGDWTCGRHELVLVCR